MLNNAPPATWQLGAACQLDTNLVMVLREFNAWAMLKTEGKVLYVQVCNRRDQNGKFTAKGNGCIILGFEMPDKVGKTWPKEMKMQFVKNSGVAAEIKPLHLGRDYYENPVDSLQRKDEKGEAHEACNNCGHIPGGHIPRKGGQRCEYDNDPKVDYDATRNPVGLYHKNIMALFKDTSNDKAKTEMDKCGARYGWCKAVKKVGEPCDKNKRKKCDRLPCALIAKGSSMEERCRPC